MVSSVLACYRVLPSLLYQRAVEKSPERHLNEAASSPLSRHPETEGSVLLRTGDCRELTTLGLSQDFFFLQRYIMYIKSTMTKVTHYILLPVKNQQNKRFKQFHKHPFLYEFLRYEESLLEENSTRFLHTCVLQK